MPAGMARHSARSRPAPASWKVAGSRSSTSVMAGSPWRKDSPKSPRNAPFRKRRYCTATGSSKPMALQAGDVLGGRIGRKEERGRIAREMQDEEDHDGDAEENEDG